MKQHLTSGRRALAVTVPPGKIAERALAVMVAARLAQIVVMAHCEQAAGSGTAGARVAAGSDVAAAPTAAVAASKTAARAFVPFLPADHPSAAELMIQVLCQA